MAFGHMDPQSMICRLFFSILFCTALAADKTYISPNGKNCLPCPIGTKVLEHCRDDVTPSTCADCETHFFSELPNSNTFCVQCSTSCPKNGYAASDCTATKDLICICNDGFHRYPFDKIDPTFECRKHSTCAAGEGEVHHGNFTHDTYCRKCTNKEFVDASDKDHPVCKTCNVCPADRQVVKICSLDGDSQCGPMINGSDNTTTRPTTDAPTTGASPKREELSGGAIAGIIIVIVLVVAAIVVIYFWYRKRHTNKGEPVVFNTEGENRLFLPSNGGSDTQNGIVPTGGSHTSLLEENDGGQGNNDLQAAAAGGPAVELSGLEWDEDFILRTVFFKLTRYLGDQWTHFIRQLPGWKDMHLVNGVIAYAKQDFSNTTEQIDRCLQEWKQQCPDKVTRVNILQTLTKVGLEDIRQNLEGLQPLTTHTSTSS